MSKSKAFNAEGAESAAGGNKEAGSTLCRCAVKVWHVCILTPVLGEDPLFLTDPNRMGLPGGGSLVLEWEAGSVRHRRTYLEVRTNWPLKSLGGLAMKLTQAAR